MAVYVYIGKGRGGEGIVKLKKHMPSPDIPFRRGQGRM